MCNCQNSSTSPVNRNIQSNDNCEYSLETVASWKNTLLCIQTSGLNSEIHLTNPQINSFVGILLSAINTGSTCFFVNEINQIKPYILNIINLNLCQNI